jgi:flagellar motor switch protein FliN/FliY
MDNLEITPEELSELVGGGLSSSTSMPFSTSTPVRPAPSQQASVPPPVSQSTSQLTARPAEFASLYPTEPASSSTTNLDLLLGVTLRVTVELGRTKMNIEEVLKLGPGSVVELDKLAGEPVDVLVNDRLIARGEVVVLDDRFGVRITDVVSPAQRLDSLR